MRWIACCSFVFEYVYLLCVIVGFVCMRLYCLFCRVNDSLVSSLDLPLYRRRVSFVLCFRRVTVVGLFPVSCVSPFT